jgi:hypothetical protein
MEGAISSTYVSSRIDSLLSQVAGTPTVANALLDALSRHIDHKTHSLRQNIQRFESKWDMSFEEFSARVKAGKMIKQSARGDLENDLQAWEQAVSLLKHYKSLRTR